MRIKTIIFSLVLLTVSYGVKAEPSSQDDSLTIRIIGDIMMHTR